MAYDAIEECHPLHGSLEDARHLDHLGETFALGRRIEARGFVSFALPYHRPHVARNPRTGESVAVPGKYVVHFKASKAFSILSGP